jgi:Zn finger protein HypA/HybF involved in hydrogenase expression
MIKEMTDDDDFDKKYIRDLTLKCGDCGLVFRKKHEYVCPACAGRNISKPTSEEFDRYYDDQQI